MLQMRPHQSKLFLYLLLAKPCASLGLTLAVGTIRCSKFFLPPADAPDPLVEYITDEDMNALSKGT